MPESTHTAAPRHEQTVPAPTRLGPDYPVDWYWIEASGDQPGYWTDDDLEAEQQRQAGRVVLTAVDGHIEGIHGCAHRADVMRLTARVWGLELTLGSLLSNLQHGLEDIGGPGDMLPEGGEDA